MKHPKLDKFEKLSRGGKQAAGDLDRVAPAGEETAEICYRTTLSTRQILRQIALNERSSVQALLTEAINALLISRDRDPSA
jgi:hypothetical protein